MKLGDYDRIRLADSSKLQSRLSQRIFISAWQLFAENFNYSEIRHDRALSIIWPDVPLGTYNNIFIRGPLKTRRQLDTRLDLAIAFVQTRSQQGILTICLDTLSDELSATINEIFVKRDYVPVMPTTGMTMQVAEFQSDIPRELRIERADNDGRVVTDLNCRAYGFPVEIGRGSLPRHSMWQNGYPFVGYVGGEAVCTATTLVRDGMLYLALVATIPEARTRGYGTAIIAHAVATAAKATNLMQIALHATDVAFPIYRRMGFEPTARFVSYGRRPT